MSRGDAGVGRGWQRSVGVGRGPQGQEASGGIGRCHWQPLQLSTANPFKTLI